MKKIPRLLILAIIAASLHQTINAEEPSLREQFKTAVETYQKAATLTNALKVIEIFKQLEPPPAVPEEAREPFVMGATVLKEANDAASAGKAAKLILKAIHLAPWWAEARYNHALASESGGWFSDAIYDLNIYLTFKLTDEERREAQDKIYALKAKAELAAAKKAEEDKVAAARKAEADKVASAADEKRQAEQAKTKAIELVKAAVGNKAEVQEFMGTYNSSKPFGGLNLNELNEGTHWYNFGNGNAWGYWKFLQDRVEIWVIYMGGASEVRIIGEPEGPNLNQMRWYWAGNNGKGKRMWAELSTKGCFIYSSNRPVDGKVDSNERYNYTLLQH